MRDLKAAFPEMSGFSPSNLKYMRRFAEEYPDLKIGQQAADQLPWWHNVVLMTKVSNITERAWYAQKTVEHGWSRNVLTIQALRAASHQRQDQQFRTEFARATIRSGASAFERSLYL